MIFYQVSVGTFLLMPMYTGLMIVGTSSSEGQFMEWQDPGPHQVNAIAVAGYQQDADFQFLNEGRTS